jgi:prevent-host-death family protein
MRIAPLADVKHRFSDFIEEARKEPIFITRRGRVAAVLEAISDDDIEDFLLERSDRFRKMLDAAARKGGGITLAAYRRKRKV